MGTPIDSSNLFVEIGVAAASLCIGGLVSYIVYVRHRQACSFQLLKGSFPNVINFSLTSFQWDTMHIRTIFETDLVSLTRNNGILIDIIQRSRNRCSEDAALLREPAAHVLSVVHRLFYTTIPWASATQHLHMLIYNELIARYSSHGEIARIAGSPVKEVPFYFAITCEQGVDINATKIRVILIEQDQLLLETGDERETLPEVLLPGQLIRYRSLCEMRRKVLEEHDMMARGEKFVRQVWEVLLSIEVPPDVADLANASEWSEPKDVFSPEAPKRITEEINVDMRVPSKESIPSIAVRPSPSINVSRSNQGGFLSEYDELSMPSGMRRSRASRGASVMLQTDAPGALRNTCKRTVMNARITTMQHGTNPNRDVQSSKTLDDRNHLHVTTGRHLVRLSSSASKHSEGVSRRGSRDSLISTNALNIVPASRDSLGEADIADVDPARKSEYCLPGSLSTNPVDANSIDTQVGSGDNYAITGNNERVPILTRVRTEDGTNATSNVANTRILTVGNAMSTNVATQMRTADGGHGTGGTGEWRLERTDEDMAERINKIEERIETIVATFKGAQMETLAKVAEVLAELRKPRVECAT